MIDRLGVLVESGRRVFNDSVPDFACNSYLGAVHPTTGAVAKSHSRPGEHPSLSESLVSYCILRHL